MRIIFTLAALGLVVGCKTGGEDNDGDGFSAADDCNDDNPDVNPDAEEVPSDGIDSDCDGFERCWVDTDGDGFGDGGVLDLSTNRTCSAPGFASNGDDCDDGEDGASPDMEEIAGDGIDNDCDGNDLCFEDADGDGFGEGEAVPAPTCQAAGLASMAGDCDDAQADVFPGAPDIDDDGVDTDCGGEVLCFADNDGDGFGGTLVEAASCEDAGLAETSDDCDDGDSDVNPAASEVVADGIDQDCDTMELCYADLDGDGAGGDTTTAGPLDCVGAGLDTLARDCDDTDDTIAPGALEGVADGVDSDCDGTELCYGDTDGDGYGGTNTVTGDLACADAGVAAVDGDCDDTVDTISPEGVESIADGVDSDCDGTELCYADTDADGYGGVNTTLGDLTCSGAGLAALDGDCDDTVDTISPDADDLVADGVDSDCDGFEVCYEDLDTDGFGGAGTVLADLACSGSGAASSDDDCDDGDPDVNPGASEAPGDDVDSDCDGSELCFVDDDGDGFGAGETSSADISCTSSGLAADGGDCDDEDDFIYPGRSEFCDGVDTDCDPATGEAGLAGFHRTSTGERTDITAIVTGTPTDPGAYSTPGSGELRFCEGTFYTEVLFEGSTDVVGAGEELTTVSGANLVRPFRRGHQDQTHTFFDLTIRDGIPDTSDIGPGPHKGGLMEITSNNDVTFTHVTFEGGVADRAGALDIEGSSVTIESCTFRSNQSTALESEVSFSGEGGAIFAEGSSFYGPTTLTITNSVFENNNAVHGSHAIYMRSGEGNVLDIENTDFIEAPDAFRFGSEFFNPGLGATQFCDDSTCDIQLD